MNSGGAWSAVPVPTRQEHGEREQHAQRTDVLLIGASNQRRQPRGGVCAWSCDIEMAVLIVSALVSQLVEGLDRVTPRNIFKHGGITRPGRRLACAGSLISVANSFTSLRRLLEAQLNFPPSHPNRWMVDAFQFGRERSGHCFH